MMANDMMDDNLDPAESPVSIIKQIAKGEVEKVRMMELATVTKIRPHNTSKDMDNYACDVRLKNSDGDNELQKVPILTPHIGFTWVPNVGDLVLIGYVGGSVNSPIVIGSLYSGDKRPPLNDKDQAICSSDNEGFTQLDFTVGSDNNMKIDSDKGFQWDAGDVRLYLSKRHSEVAMHDNKNDTFWIGSQKGDISIAGSKSIEIAIMPNTSNPRSASGNEILIKTDGQVTIKAGTINLSGDVAINGGSIKLKGSSISIESSGSLDLKGSQVNIN
jgi:phage baseplate assembly protein gpV